MLYDTHAHLDLIEKKQLAKVIENAKKTKVKFIITQSVNLDSAKKSLEIAKKYPEIVKLSAGLYPEETLKENDFKELKEFILKNKKDVFAIGEIGMDFSQDLPNKKLQEKIFTKQLELAQELNLPVSIHTRKAEKEIIEILKDYPKVKKVLHCFSGKLKLVNQAEKIGCYFSIPANINRAQHFQHMVKILPKNKILTETDTPYLSPFRETINEPANIKETIKTISKIYGKTEKEIEDQIEQNFKKLYVD